MRETKPISEILGASSDAHASAKPPLRVSGPSMELQSLQVLRAILDELRRLRADIAAGHGERPIEAKAGHER